MYSSQSQTSLSQQPLFEVSLFAFHIASALQYLDYCYGEYPVKQTVFLYLKLPLKPSLFSVFLLFLER